MIRHHIYPRKKLYVPTEDDIKLYPTLQPIRVTELEDDDSTLDDPNQIPRCKNDKAKQSRFHGTETIQEEPVPCMS